MTTTAPGATLDPLALMGGLMLDTGTTWAARALEFQQADAAAILSDPEADDPGPRMHFITRPRGGSKTTDLAAICLAVLLTQAPPHSTSHAYARDKDQAALLLAALTALAHRSGLAGLLDLTTWGATVKTTGARLVVESADAASAYGHLPYFVVVDEVAQWPTTRGARTLWEAIVSGLPKRRDSRLVVLTTAGDPAHWSQQIITGARSSSRWRVSETPGPLPWADPEDLAEQRRLLPASSYARLHLNQWTASEDRLTDPDDLAACVAHSGTLEPDTSLSYVIGLDLGLKNDRTVLTVCHADTLATGGPTASGTGSRVVLDRLHVMAGSKASPVQLADVEAITYEASRAYGGAPVRVDPWQAAGVAQRLRSRGVAVQEWTFTPASIGRLAMNLHLLLRERRLVLPDDPDLLDELANVRLRETTPGVYRMDHDSGHHDDRAVSLGLAALALTEKAPTGRGMVTVPGSSRAAASVASATSRFTLPQRVAARPTMPTALQVKRAAATPGQRAGRALLIPGSANDPRRTSIYARDRRRGQQ
ncbi:hypothetical protein [Citricoccus nitrophenolicus]|uniref:hypothetical protein n=1 Tax=Citricoccus nitrophenolicus TaxID=863575 RepID=UPI0039B5A764